MSYVHFLKRLRVGVQKLGEQKPQRSRRVQRWSRIPEAVKRRMQSEGEPRPKVHSTTTLLMRKKGGFRRVPEDLEKRLKVRSMSTGGVDIGHPDDGARSV